VHSSVHCSDEQLLLLLLLLLTTRLAWRLVQKLQAHVTHKKDMFGRQRKKTRRSAAPSVRGRKQVRL